MALLIGLKRGEYYLYELLKDGKVVSTAEVCIGHWQLPFFTIRIGGKKEYHIGPCMTCPNERGKGYYAMLLQAIMNDLGTQNNYYMIVHETNIPSLRGIAKVGFSRIGVGVKNKFGQYIITKKDNQMDSRWHLYQGALVWNGNPRQAAPTQEEARQAIAESGAMFARWTSNYDCGYPTEWWHCIKDTPFDLQKISAKHRYIIKQGIKYFDVHEIDPVVYAEELYQVQVEAFKVYPKQYRPTLDKQKTIAGLENGGWNAPYKVFAAFHRETGQMAGFTLVREREERVDLISQKTVPAMEKLQVNAALVYAVVMHYNERLSPDFYIVDGERNIKHETNFFQYLIKYFEFRSAYCRLNIEYNNRMRLIINLLYPFRGVAKLLRKLHPLINNVYCVLYQEQIRRSF